MHHARTHSVGKSQSGGNPERAFELFQAAAEKGFYPAWNALASMHLDVRTRILASLSRYPFELIGQFQPCMTYIYLHIDARMADYISHHL